MPQQSLEVQICSKSETRHAVGTLEFTRRNLTSHHLTVGTSQHIGRAERVSRAGGCLHTCDGAAPSLKPLEDTPSVENIQSTNDGVNSAVNVKAVAISVFKPRTRRNSVWPPIVALRHVPETNEVRRVCSGVAFGREMAAAAAWSFSRKHHTHCDRPNPPSWSPRTERVCLRNVHHRQERCRIHRGWPERSRESWSALKAAQLDIAA